MNANEQWFKQLFYGKATNRKAHCVKQEKWVLVYIYNGIVIIRIVKRVMNSGKSEYFGFYTKDNEI
jgi:hypothetical protein